MGNVQFQKMTVLVVDNTNAMRCAVASMLSEMGFAKVYQAHNGTEALKYIARVKFDFILSEWQLQKMDGIELLIKVRKDPKNSTIPFIITSAEVQQNEVIRAIKCGVSEYIVKPFSPKILQDRLLRALSRPISVSNSAAMSASQTETKQQALQILVVDDIPDNIQVISELLKSKYTVKAATSGEKALAICQSKSPPDLVLLDIMMPGMSGIEVCQQLKENPATQHITVIFLTALDQTEDMVKGLELGAVDYITKPINPPVVIARVNTHSKLIERQREMRNQVDTLIENERLKNEFDRVMQNDLKQPVSELVKSIEVIERYARDPQRVKQLCKTATASCDFLQQIIDNMLLLYKLEEGSYVITPTRVDFYNVTNKAIDTFKTSITKKQLEILNEVKKGVHILGESLLTLSLVSNLLKNAIEAAPRGSVVKINHLKRDDFETLSIYNQGAVPAEIMDNFFGKYVTAGKKDGSGLGTYSAKLMVESQNGVIEFESSEEQGTTLMIALPSFN